MKSMLSLLFLVASPVMAIQLMKVPTADIPDDPDSAERAMRKVGKAKGHAWITFMGDSNMRNTYWWFVTSKLNKTGVKLLHSKQFGYKQEQKDSFVHDPHVNNEWSDQEAVLEYPDGFMVRASMRFLHGSSKEFKFKTSNWNNASLSSMMDAVPEKDKEMAKAHLNADQKEMAMDDPDALEPSQYAQWATKQNKFIDYSKDVPFLARRLAKYQGEKPDVVVLTEGWGGIPGCDRFDEVQDIFKKNPETKFVWSPVYMTNRLKKRQECFASKIEAAPQQPNEKYINMWDAVQEYYGEQTKVARGREGTKHMHLGGDYMKLAVKRFEDAIDDLSK